MSVILSLKLILNNPAQAISKSVEADIIFIFCGPLLKGVNMSKFAGVGFMFLHKMG